MPTQEAQHARRQRLLLLLLAASTAGIGLSLALADDAHASDRDHTGPVAGTLSAVTDTTTALTDRAQPQPKRGPAKPAGSRRDHTHPTPKPTKRAVGDTLNHTSSTVDRAVKTTHDISRAAASLTTIVGDPVQRITQPVRQITNPATLLPALPGLTLPGVTTPPTTGSPTLAAPQTAPEPAANNPPLVTAGSGAPTPTTGPPAHPGCGHQHHPAPGATAPHPPAVGPSHRHIDLNGGGDQAGSASATNSPHPAAPTDRWTGPRTNTSPAHGGARAHTGRTHPPSPPTG